MTDLTHEQIDEMEAGREMDALVAERVMGWELFTLTYWEDDESERQKELRDWLEKVELDWIGDYFINTEKDSWIDRGNWIPSVLIGAAMKMVEKLESHPDEILFSLVRKGFHMKALYWAATFRECRGRQKYYYCEADTAPLAICRAALKAVIKEKE